MPSSGTFNTGYITRVSFIAALGGYLFGFDFAVIAGALPFLREQFGLDEYAEGFTTASLALGCIVGCLIAGRLSDRYGRKPALMTAAAVFLFSSLAMAAAGHLQFFILSRFFAGVGVGMASVLAPLYIAEIAPASVRGRMVAINQLTIVTGILITNIANYLLSGQGADAWRWMFGLGALPSALFFVGVYFLPESPRWLYFKGRHQKAEQVLRRLGNEVYAADAMMNMQRIDGQAGVAVSGELVNGGTFAEPQMGGREFDEQIKQGETEAEIKQSVPRQSAPDTAIRQNASRPGIRVLFEPTVLPAVLIGIGLAVFQQFCGINVVFNFTTTIFESIGFSQEDQLWQTVLIGAVNLVFTLVAMWRVDKTGRKPLMLFGAGGLVILYLASAGLLQAGSSLAALTLLAAIAVYAMTLAPITWVLISEIFPVKARGIATSTAVIFLWIAYGLLVFSFPILAEKTGAYTPFYIYAGICLVGLLFVAKKVKETKGRTLEEIQPDGISHRAGTAPPAGLH